MNETGPAVCIMHPFDPRSEKVGGLETYIRDFIRHYPSEWRLLLVCIDSLGDLQLRKISRVDLFGRKVEMLPLARFGGTALSKAAASLRDSLTGKFLGELAKNFIALRRELREGCFSVDLRRVEFSPFCVAFGVPFVQMLHGSGQNHRQKTDSLLHRYGYVHVACERLALSKAHRFFFVNDGVRKAYEERLPRLAPKFGTVSTWADPRVFRPTRFPDDSSLELVYVGRLEAVKDPQLMFLMLRELKARGVPATLHLVGDDDPCRYPAFHDVEECVVMHGYQDSVGIAETLSQVHIGILFSHFEGMPRFVLECLASGRPVVTTDLPCLADLVRADRCGERVEARDPARLADAVERVYASIRTGWYSPDKIAAYVEDFTPTKQLDKVFSAHYELFNAGRTKRCS